MKYLPIGSANDIKQYVRSPFGVLITNFTELGTIEKCFLNSGHDVKICFLA